MFKKIVPICIFCFFSFFSSAQTKYNANLLDTLEQIAASNTPSAVFASLYYKAIEITNKHAHTLSKEAKEFTFKFEAAFAPLFFEAHKNYLLKKPLPSSWQGYYKYSNLNELQYQFLGMNAHINGDMCNALTAVFTYDTLKKYKKPLIKYQSAFNTFFDSIYLSTKKVKGARFIHTITLGLDKWVGKKLVLKWRKRQIKMALLWYQNPKAYKRKKARVSKKMLWFDRFAIQHLR
jgi:hypothetical protein